MNTRVKNLYIQDVSGIELLDHSWAPRFKQLERIEIYFTDIRIISRNFGLLHRDNLKYLTVRAAKIEVTEPKVFEELVNLEYLDLSANPIKQFSDETFYGLISLKSLVLHSILDTYIIDDNDICMLSYLPCRTDVYLDSYDDFFTSCALVYLHELRNDSAKFRSIVRSNYFLSLSSNDILYQRDEICNLGTVLKSCIDKSDRNSHCLFDMFNLMTSSDTITGIIETNANLLENPLTSNSNSIRFDLESTQLPSELALEKLKSSENSLATRHLVTATLPLTQALNSTFLAAGNINSTRLNSENPYSNSLNGFTTSGFLNDFKFIQNYTTRLSTLSPPNATLFTIFSSIQSPFQAKLNKYNYNSI